MLTYDDATQTWRPKHDDPVEHEWLRRQVEWATVAYWSAATSDINEVAVSGGQAYEALRSGLVQAVTAYAISLGEREPAFLAVIYLDVLAATGIEGIGHTMATCMDIRDGQVNRP